MKLILPIVDMPFSLKIAARKRGIDQNHMFNLIVAQDIARKWNYHQGIPK
jgi:hypothetical protein